MKRRPLSPSPCKNSLPFLCHILIFFKCHSFPIFSILPFHTYFGLPQCYLLLLIDIYLSPSHLIFQPLKG